MLFCNTASVLGGAPLLPALLYLSKIGVFRMCLAPSLLFWFTEKALHVPEVKPTQKFFQANAALVMREI